MPTPVVASVPSSPVSTESPQSSPRPCRENPTIMIFSFFSTARTSEYLVASVPSSPVSAESPQSSPRPFHENPIMIFNFVFFFFGALDDPHRATWIMQIQGLICARVPVPSPPMHATCVSRVPSRSSRRDPTLPYPPADRTVAHHDDSDSSPPLSKFPTPRHLPPSKLFNLTNF
ncbi:hypothetical protein K439DRAFT_1621721 [Ramaria rubella]|nr:hypothetical protein K439DRAFT_1621721 [Ramaria rubella]